MNSETQAVKEAQENVDPCSLLNNLCSVKRYLRSPHLIKYTKYVNVQPEIDQFCHAEMKTFHPLSYYGFCEVSLGKIV